jgi:hypothetical protein
MVSMYVGALFRTRRDTQRKENYCEKRRKVKSTILLLKRYMKRC